MDCVGFLFFLAGLIGYYVTKRRYPYLLFVGGLGAGVLIGAVWAAVVVNQFLR